MYSAVRLPGRMPGNEPAVLPHVLRDIIGIEDDRGVEVREEDDAGDVQQVVERHADAELLRDRVDPRALEHACAIVAGNARIDEAKITGMTPPVLTLSGMCVLDPPYIRRPTTRLAYWTVTRRCPRSTKMIAAITSAIMTSRNRIADQPDLPGAHLIERLNDGAREADDDARVDDERHAVADAALGDLLAQPHDEAGAGRQRQHRHQPERQPGL